MIYKYRGTIPGSKIFLREYEIKESTSLYSFHEFLLNDFGFAPDQMVLFRGLKAGDKVGGEYGLFDFGDGSMDTITLKDLISKGENAFLYVFDIKKDRVVKFDFIGEVEKSPRASYPRLVAEKGRNPEQFAKEYNDFDQVPEQMNESEESFMEDELPTGTDSSEEI